VAGPDLARINGAVDVQHLVGRHAYRFGHCHPLIGAVARMAAAKVIGHPPPNQVEFDPAADAIAVRIRLDLLERQHLRLQKLQLQRHQQSILRPPWPHPHETLARDKHLASDHGLQAVEIGQPIGIRLIRPGEPELLNLVAQRRVSDERRRLDAIADEVRGKGLTGVRRVAVGDDQFPRARQELWATRSNQRVYVLERRVPTAQAALGHRSL